MLNIGSIPEFVPLAQLLDFYSALSEANSLNK